MASIINDENKKRLMNEIVATRTVLELLPIMEPTDPSFRIAIGRCPMRITTLAIAAFVLFVVSVPLYAGQTVTVQDELVENGIQLTCQHVKV